MFALILVTAAYLPTASAGSSQCYSAHVANFVESPVLSAFEGNSDFAQVFNPSWIKPSAGTGFHEGLLVRSQNCTSCGQDQDHCCGCSGTGPKASVLSFARLESQDSSAAAVPKISRVSASSVVFGPHDESDVNGVEDPRIAYDEKTGLYHVLYTCFGSKLVELCHAVTPDPTSSANWTRLGPLGFGDGSKSGALLIREEGSHYLYWGAGHIRVTKSSDLNTWTAGEGFIHQTLFGHPNVETGPPPMKLSSGDYVLFINSWSNSRSDPDWYQPSWVILDGRDPAKIIAQALEPLFTPSQAPWMRGLPPYQCNVQNVAFLEAAHQIAPDSFRVYFGGSDAVIGTAVINFTKNSACTSATTETNSVVV
eukprot:TRINITY_DN48108_c0_g1_i1.p1 TRINITY_DN48108_c0_g1~~TRINITY_DN48108_c0_g1_i1.p1  ORF type:complete len:394 (+),score=38.01 TRINITY_DN48108_c0_g1_i1:85-1182(+)